MRCCACRQPRITPAYAGKRVDLANTGKCPRDHPRVCGEKFRGARFRDRRMGSPPRMRGKATSSCFWQLLRGDHPRVCGEKMEARTRSVSISGSPPRMRGKETPSLVVVRGSRITPAYAGKSLPEELEQALPKDHPRVCGEKACMQCTLQGHGGSPPRMRGKGRRNGRAFPGNGITPAYAGKSGFRRFSSGPRRDHPRVCGEKNVSKDALFLSVGSPPRMRGKGVPTQPERTAPGITPAYAGKSPGSCRYHLELRDHPRVCGEKGLTFHQMLRPTGSPPRMRGKEGQPGRVERGTGITPAYAGKRPLPSSGGTRVRDHPRVCGEKAVELILSCHSLGSPPRMRGKA